jgi:hypothetical protein
MQIDITEFFTREDAGQYSASVAELGQNAGQITWVNSLQAGAEYAPLDDEEKREAFRERLKPYGAWDDAEIAAFTDAELNALFVQWVAGDMREAGLDDVAPDWADYQARAENGECPSNIWRDDDGRVFFSLEH